MVIDIYGANGNRYIDLSTLSPLLTYPQYRPIHNIDLSTILSFSMELLTLGLVKLQIQFCYFENWDFGIYIYTFWQKHTNFQNQRKTNNLYLTTFRCITFFKFLTLWQLISKMIKVIFQCGVPNWAI